MFTIESLAVLAEASGFALNPLSWWDTLGSGRTLLAAAGERPRPVAVVGLLDPGDVELAAAADTDSPTLHGSVRRVPDVGDIVDLLVVHGQTVYVLPADQVHVQHSSGPGFDPLRPTRTVRFPGCAVRRLALPDPVDALRAARLHALVLLAAEAVGVADWALEHAVDHARTRQQFGRAIGTYQGVAHLLAECYADLELARSALWYALACLGPDAVEVGADPQTGVAVAGALASRAARHTTEVAMQVLGATSITWMHPVHLWYRRGIWIAAQLAGANDPWRHICTPALLSDDAWWAST